jgi:hypothetical protein
MSIHFSSWPPETPFSSVTLASRSSAESRLITLLQAIEARMVPARCCEHAPGENGACTLLCKAEHAPVISTLVSTLPSLAFLVSGVDDLLAASGLAVVVVCCKRR